MKKIITWLTDWWLELVVVVILLVGIYCGISYTHTSYHDIKSAAVAEFRESWPQAQPVSSLCYRDRQNRNTRTCVVTGLVGPDCLNRTRIHDTYAETKGGTVFPVSRIPAWQGPERDALVQFNTSNPDFSGSVLCQEVGYTGFTAGQMKCIVSAQNEQQSLIQETYWDL